MSASLEGNVTLSDFEPRLDKGHERLVLADGEHGLQEEALGVHQLGVELHLGVRVVVSPPHHLAQGLGQTARLLPEPEDKLDSENSLRLLVILHLSMVATEADRTALAFSMCS